MAIEGEIKEYAAILDQELGLILKEKFGHEDIIFESINYSLLSAGKRLRPILVLKSYELFSQEDYQYALPFALAIEMIHTYSLIHDDLPAMDDDDFRRGQPSNHIKYGVAMAILSGDGLLNLAFETMLKHAWENLDSVDEYKRNIRAMKEIGNYSGIYGMIGGQVLDLLAEDREMDEERILFMYENKTAGLIKASLVAGAILAGANDMEIEAIREFGHKLGLAYQIQDDILDLEEDQEIGKVTYASLKGKEVAREKVKNLSERALNILDSFEGKDTGFLRQITKLLVYRSY